MHACGQHNYAELNLKGFLLQHVISIVVLGIVIGDNLTPDCAFELRILFTEEE